VTMRKVLYLMGTLTDEDAEWLAFHLAGDADRRMAARRFDEMLERPRMT